MTLPSPSWTRIAFGSLGSYYLQEWHQRWFRQHLPKDGVQLTNLTDQWMGFSLSGPELAAGPGAADT